MSNRNKQLRLEHLRAGGAKGEWAGGDGGPDGASATSKWSPRAVGWSQSRRSRRHGRSEEGFAALGVMMAAALAPQTKSMLAA